MAYCRGESCRKDYLLRRCYELLKKQDDSNFVLNLLEEEIFYDDAKCDGYWLMSDIEDTLML